MNCLCSLLIEEMHPQIKHKKASAPIISKRSGVRNYNTPLQSPNHILHKTQVGVLNIKIELIIKNCLLLIYILEENTHSIRYYQKNLCIELNIYCTQKW